VLFRSTNVCARYTGNRILHQGARYISDVLNLKSFQVTDLDLSGAPRRPSPARDEKSQATLEHAGL